LDNVTLEFNSFKGLIPDLKYRQLELEQQINELRSSCSDILKELKSQAE